jgi:hypothetical protein
LKSHEKILIWHEFSSLWLYKGNLGRLNRGSFSNWQDSEKNREAVNEKVVNGYRTDHFIFRGYNICVRIDDIK